MTLDELVEKMNAALAQTGGIERSIKLDLGEDGQIFAHGLEAVAEDRDADCTISMSKDNFMALAKGELDPMAAFMSNKLRLTGDMSVALGLQKLFAAR